MRIGILTLPLHTNYGGILQAYALQTVLERMGHEVTIIDEPIRKMKTSNKAVIKRIIKKIIGMKTTILWEKYLYETHPIVSQNIQPFIDKYLHRVVVESPAQLAEKDFDAIVVGSDQIWRPIYYKQIEHAYLDFAEEWKNIKRIAYAPSFGTDQWEYTEKQTAICSKLLKLFDAVSVREESGMALCQENFGIKPSIVLDPTLLLSPSDYDNLIESSGVASPNGKLLNYVLDKSDSVTAIIAHISREKNMKAFSVNGIPLVPGGDAEDSIMPSIESWLCGFRDAEFVVTDSFHACVFSLIFNKPFCVVGNKARGMARFNSLLKMFGQEFRMTEGLDDYYKNKERLCKAPNVNVENSEQKKHSISFINKVLS